MHKITISGVLLCGLIILAGCVTGGSQHTANLYQKVKAASVEILIEGRLEGSGWFADSTGLIITAAHAVSRSNVTIEVVSGIRGRLPAEVVATDRGHDIALLRVQKSDKPYICLETASRIPEPGSLVYLYGAALFHHGIMLGGTVARDDTTFTYYQDRHMLVRCYHVTAPSPPGTSGGPWLDACGHVVGNQSGFITHHNAGAGIAIVSPPDAIRRLVSSKTSVPTPTLGCGLEELWSQAPGFIKRFPTGTQGVLTIPIDKGGPAETAGLNKESLVIAVEGKSVSYKDDLYRSIHGKKPGDLVNLSVLDPDKTSPHDVRIRLGSVE